MTKKEVLIEMGLTKREADVALLVPSAMKNEPLAEALGVSVGAVKFHLSTIYKKFGLCNRRELAVLVNKTFENYRIFS